MQHVSTVFGQVITLCAVTAEAGGPPFMPTLVARMAERFRFTRLPDLETADPTDGIALEHGTRSGTDAIDRLAFFPNGFIVEARNTTDYGEAVAADVLETLREAGFVVGDAPALTQIYLSEVEVVLDLGASDLVDRLRRFGETVGHQIGAYGGGETLALSLYGMQWRMGKGRQTPLFRLETSERADAPPGTIYAAASLKTRDHLRLLGELEAIFTGKT